MDKNFSLYLINIGFCDENSSKQIMKYNIQLKDKNFVDSAFHYLMNFVDNLDENQKKYMSYYIPNNYKNIITKIRSEKIKSLFIHKMLRQKFILLKYLYLWKRNKNLYVISSNKEEYNKYINEENDKLIPKDIKVRQNQVFLKDYFEKENKKKEILNIKNILNSINNKSHKSHNERTFNKLNYNLPKKPDLKYIHNNLYQRSISKNKNKNKNKLLTSLESKELADLKECTFKPRINICSSKTLLNSNSNNKSKENIMSVFEKLYKDKEKAKLTKELKTIDMEYNLGEKFSFTPNIKQRYRKIYKYQEHKNFIQRQKVMALLYPKMFGF